MAGDPNFIPTMKGEFAIDPRGRPKQARMIAGQIIVEDVYAPPSDESNGIDQLLMGITSSDLRSHGSGFGRFATQRDEERGIQHHGEAGSGPPDTRRFRRTNPTPDYDNGLIGGQSLDTGEVVNEEVGDMDLLGEDYETHAPREFGDFPADTGDVYREHTKSPNVYDQEDLWSRDVFEDFEKSRRNKRNPDEPTFSGQPHRQQEASLTKELTDLFDLDIPSDTFSNRGL